MAIRIGLGLSMGISGVHGQEVEVAASPATALMTAVDATALTYAVPPTANLVLDFDMLDPASYTVVPGSPDVVSQITNRQSSVSWAEATNRPEYEAAGLNGYPCMVGNGTSARFISTEAAVFGTFANANPYTIYYVAKHAGVVVSEALFGVGNSGAANSVKYWGQATGGSGRWRANTVDNAGTAIALSSTAGSNTNANVFCWSNDSTTTDLRTNGAAVAGYPAAQAPGTTTVNRSALFCRPPSVPSLFYAGRFGAMLIYSIAHDAATQLAVARYLGSRWGITVA